MLDVSPSTISMWNTGNLPKMAKMLLECMLKNKNLEEKLETIKKARNIILNL